MSDLHIDRRDNTLLIQHFERLEHQLEALDARLCAVETIVSKSSGFIGGVVACFSFGSAVVYWVIDHLPIHK